MEPEETDMYAFRLGQILWIGSDDWGDDSGEGLTIVGAEIAAGTTGVSYRLMRSNGTVMVLSQGFLLEFYRIGKLQILV